MNHTVQDLIVQYLQQRKLSAEQLAIQAGVALPTIEGLVAEGKLPRKAEHREYLRQVLGLDVEEWAEAMLTSCGLPLTPDARAPAQILLARAMFRQGLTEQSLSRLSRVPYGTVLGLIRKGALPRGKTLDRIGDALGLEPAAVAAAVKRTKVLSQAILTAAERPMPSVPEGLAHLVARRIREQNMTIGSYAKSMGLGYLTLSRFLESGELPDEDDFLTTIQEDLSLSEEALTAALETSRHEPKPATVSARAGEPPPDASPLQVALLRYLNDHKMTIKAMANKAGLSQITMSRLVKQGVPPSRSRTHSQLCELLGLSQSQYDALISGRSSGPSEALAPKTDALNRSDNGPSRNDEDYHSTDSISISDAELTKLIRQLSRQQRTTLASFLRTLLNA